MSAPTKTGLTLSGEESGPEQLRVSKILQQRIDENEERLVKQLELLTQQRDPRDAVVWMVDVNDETRAMVQAINKNASPELLRREEAVLTERAQRENRRPVWIFGLDRETSRALMAGREGTAARLSSPPQGKPPVVWLLALIEGGTMLRPLTYWRLGRGGSA